MPRHDANSVTRVGARKRDYRREYRRRKYGALRRGIEAPKATTHEPLQAARIPHSADPGPDIIRWPEHHREQPGRFIPWSLSAPHQFLYRLPCPQAAFCAQIALRQAWATMRDFIERNALLAEVTRVVPLTDELLARDWWLDRPQAKDYEGLDNLTRWLVTARIYASPVYSGLLLDDVDIEEQDAVEDAVGQLFYGLQIFSRVLVDWGRSTPSASMRPLLRPDAPGPVECPVDFGEAASAAIRALTGYTGDQSWRERWWAECRARLAFKDAPTATISGPRYEDIQRQLEPRRRAVDIPRRELPSADLPDPSMTEFVDVTLAASPQEVWHGLLALVEFFEPDVRRLLAETPSAVQIVMVMDEMRRLRDDPDRVPLLARLASDLELALREATHYVGGSPPQPLTPREAIAARVIAAALENFNPPDDSTGPGENLIWAYSQAVEGLSMLRVRGPEGVVYWLSSGEQTVFDDDPEWELLWRVYATSRPFRGTLGSRAAPAGTLYHGTTTHQLAGFDRVLGPVYFSRLLGDALDYACTRAHGERLAGIPSKPALLVTTLDELREHGRVVPDSTLDFATLAISLEHGNVEFHPAEPVGSWIQHRLVDQAECDPDWTTTSPYDPHIGPETTGNRRVYADIVHRQLAPVTRYFDWDAFMRNCPPGDHPFDQEEVFYTHDWMPHQPVVPWQLLEMAARLALPVFRSNPYMAPVHFEAWEQLLATIGDNTVTGLRRWAESMPDHLLLLLDYLGVAVDRSQDLSYFDLDTQLTEAQWGQIGAANTMVYQLSGIRSAILRFLVVEPALVLQEPGVDPWADLWDLSLAPIILQIADAVALTEDPSAHTDGVFSDWSDYPLSQDYMGPKATAFLQRWWDLVQCRWPVRDFSTMTLEDDPV